MARPGRTYGGLLTENLVQAIARDVFAHGVLTLEAAGYQVLFHVHDEAIVDCPLDADPAEIMRLLCTVPEWCKSLPVASECEESAHYKK
jgi:DNA polymerase